MCEHRRVAKVTGHCDAALTLKGGAVPRTKTFHAFPAFPAFSMFAVFAVFAMFPVPPRTRDTLKKTEQAGES
jgi:hypothetical protein